MSTSAATAVEPTTLSRRGDAAARAAMQRVEARAVAVWFGLIAVAVVWGRVVARRADLYVPTAPLSGKWHVEVGATTALVAVVGGLFVWMLPIIAERTRWTAMVATGALASTLWALTLTVLGGPGALLGPFRGSDQYLHTVSSIGDVHQFLATFVDHIANYNVHTQGHPPGMVLALVALDRIGMTGAGPVAVASFVGGGSATAAMLLVIRELQGAATARRAMPWLVLVPAAIWWSSADALFLGVAAWAVAFLVIATGRSGRRAVAAAVLGGALFGVALLLSYGLALLALVPLAVAVHRRRVASLVPGAVATLAVLGAMALQGFWWLAGLSATHDRYYAGVGARRPYGYFLLGDLAVFAIMVGPACFAGMAVLWGRRDRLALLVPLVGIAMVALADLSGLAKAEIERIWLPFVPWVVVAAAALVHRSGRASVDRRWLGLQVAAAIVVASLVRSPW